MNTLFFYLVINVIIAHFQSFMDLCHLIVITCFMYDDICPDDCIPFDQLKCGNKFMPMRKAISIMSENISVAKTVEKPQKYRITLQL